MYRTLKKPEPKGNLVITDRDILWIRAIHRFRFITTDQAQLLAGAKNRNNVNDRLAKLWAHDYLARPEVQVAFTRDAERPTIHALGQRGAEWLTVNDDVTFPAGKGWNTANELKSSEYLKHQIKLVDVIMKGDREFAATPGVHMTHQDQLIAQVSWPKGLRKHWLPTKVKQDGQTVDRKTNPDYTALLSQVLDDGRTGHVLNYIELDNATEDFIVANKLAASIAQKHICYADAYRRKLTKELYGYSSMRVLWVVKGNEDRIWKMIETRKRVLPQFTAQNIFWYTLYDELMEHGWMGDIWRVGDGDRKPLIIPQA